jgi:hypothetical protein
MHLRVGLLSSSMALGSSSNPLRPLSLLSLDYGAVMIMISVFVVVSVSTVSQQSLHTLMSLWSLLAWSAYKLCTLCPAPAAPDWWVPPPLRLGNRLPAGVLLAPHLYCVTYSCRPAFVGLCFCQGRV